MISGQKKLVSAVWKTLQKSVFQGWISFHTSFYLLVVICRIRPKTWELIELLLLLLLLQVFYCCCFCHRSFYCCYRCWSFCCYCCWHFVFCCCCYCTDDNSLREWTFDIRNTKNPSNPSRLMIFSQNIEFLND